MINVFFIQIIRRNFILTNIKQVTFNLLLSKLKLKSYLTLNLTFQAVIQTHT